MAGRVVVGRRAGEQVEPADQLARFPERPRAGEVVNRPRVAVGDVVQHRIDDVLADSFLPLAVHVDHGRGSRELAELAIMRGQLVAGDPDRKLGQAVVGDAHGGSDY